MDVHPWTVNGDIAQTFLQSIKCTSVPSLDSTVTTDQYSLLVLSLYHTQTVELWESQWAIALPASVIPAGTRLTENALASVLPENLGTETFRQSRCLICPFSFLNTKSSTLSFPTRDLLQKTSHSFKKGNTHATTSIHR
jgi:hypothetical protein